MTTKKKRSFGGAAFGRSSPSVEPGDKAPKILNLPLSFDEALYLQQALQDACSHMNQYRRDSKPKVVLSVKLTSKRIDVCRP
jgi:hypothetical protein